MDNKIDLKGVARFLTLAFVPTVAVSAIIRSMHVNLADKMMIITIFSFRMHEFSMHRLWDLDYHLSGL
ncbi:MAG: hypothetical protein WB014_11590 [Methanosarcina sp.]